MNERSLSNHHQPRNREQCYTLKQFFIIVIIINMIHKLETGGNRRGEWVWCTCGDFIYKYII